MKRFLRHLWPWLLGMAMAIWVLVRSGANPRRLTYPCQRAAMPIAINWILAVIALITGSLIARRRLKIAGIIIVGIGIAWFVTAIPQLTYSQITQFNALPIWQSPGSISNIVVYDNIPPSSGSLAAGNATVPDAYLDDPAIDTLLDILDMAGTSFYKTGSAPDGLIGKDNVVIIKGNFQWRYENTTSTDRIKGIIWRILNHPDGFTGEIIVCDNTQDIGTGINDSDDNSFFSGQSIIDVVAVFQAKGYPVYVLDWNYIWEVVASEYSAGDMTDGYVYETDTKISYPKFRSPSGDYYISMKNGVWKTTTSSYDPDQLAIINMPVLKAHGMAGATIGVKNWIGMLTTGYSDSRYGGWSTMHDNYFFNSYALVARVMDAIFPVLTIVDATWTTTQGPVSFDHIQNTNMLVASTDPVAASWYAAKYILTPIADSPLETDPDGGGSDYAACLNNWCNYLRNTAGRACTKTTSEISVYDRTLLDQVFACGDANDDQLINIGDAIHLANYLFKGGPPPVSMDMADINNDSEVDMDDAVYLINYIFIHGPGPSCD